MKYIYGVILLTLTSKSIAMPNDYKDPYLVKWTLIDKMKTYENNLPQFVNTDSDYKTSSRDAIAFLEDYQKNFLENHEKDISKGYVTGPEEFCIKNLRISYNTPYLNNDIGVRVTKTHKERYDSRHLTTTESIALVKEFIKKAQDSKSKM